jgi:uncharacterized integral membrane protein
MRGFAAGARHDSLLQTTERRKAMPDSEKPRSEPEIIPPHKQAGQPGRDEPRVRVFVDTRGTERVYIAKPGPLATILMILITAMLAAVLLVLFSAAFFFLLPIMIVLMAAAIIAGLVRAFFGRGP